MNDLIYISQTSWADTQEARHPFPWRLAHIRRVLFLEPPKLITTGDDCHLRDDLPFTHNKSLVTLARLCVPESFGNVCTHTDARIQAVYGELLRHYLDTHRYDSPILWINIPRAFPLADTIPHSLLIYDRLDRQNQHAKTSVARVGSHTFFLGDAGGAA